MVELISGDRLFHVTRSLPYNPHPPLAAGSRLVAGTVHNPFFGYYETPRTFAVSTASGSINVPAVSWIKHVRAGAITPSNLPQTAYEIVEHFQLLSRELVMELTRREEAPSAPSRQTCLWVTTSLDLARQWRSQLGGNGQILELEATGSIHTADAALMEGDAEAFSSVYARARQYWRGERSTAPEMETLFSGGATVSAVVG